MSKNTAAALLSALLPLGLGLALGVSAMTHDAPVGSYVGSADAIEANIAAMPMNVPTFDEFAAEFPGCESMREVPFAPAVVIVRSDRTAERLPVDEAFALVKRSPENTVWVVGVCAR